jgi:hypothetical protein
MKYDNSNIIIVSRVYFQHYLVYFMLEPSSEAMWTLHLRQSHSYVVQYYIGQILLSHGLMSQPIVFSEPSVLHIINFK